MNDITIIINFLLNYGIAGLVLAVMTFVLAQLIKWPYKKLTIKINNEGWRKAANKVIPALPFAVSIGLWYLYCIIFEVAISEEGLYIAAAVTALIAIFIYRWLEPVLKGFEQKYGILCIAASVEKKDNAEESAEEAKTIATLKDIAAGKPEAVAEIKKTVQEKADAAYKIFKGK